LKSGRVAAETLAVMAMAATHTVVLKVKLCHALRLNVTAS
jgi:Na+/serine symporter